MPRTKFSAGEPAEVLCFHLSDGEIVHDWLRGEVVQVDDRMAAVRFPCPVFTNQGLPVPTRVLWSAHGSPRIRRPAEPAAPAEE